MDADTYFFLWLHSCRKIRCTCYVIRNENVVGTKYLAHYCCHCCNWNQYTEKEFEVENEIICNEYREQITSGIPVEREVVRISFDCSFESNSVVDYAAPSIILFDSFDRRVHKDEKTINESKYLEFGEIWFDDHKVLKDDIDKIYVALTGDQCALTDIRVK